MHEKQRLRRRDDVDRPRAIEHAVRILVDGVMRAGGGSGGDVETNAARLERRGPNSLLNLFNGR